MKIVGLCGPAQSGKDTFGKMLLELSPAISSRRLAFADALKDMAGDFLGMTRIEIEGWKLKDEPVPGWAFTMRHFLQHLGTEGLREMDPDVWVKKLQMKLDLLNQSSFVVVTDVRFPNEAEWIHSKGGFLIQMLRPDVAPVRGHRSEDVSILEPYMNYVVVNAKRDNWKKNLMTQARVITEIING